MANKDTKSDKPKDGKALNQEAEDAMVAGQWAQAKADGLLDNDLHQHAVNYQRPKG